MPEAGARIGVEKPEPRSTKTPEQLADMLAKAVRGCSKVLVIVLLDLAEEYVTTQAEARAIADPTARMLSRVKLLKKPLKWITGNSDEVALLMALGAYGMRLVDPISVKIEVAQTASAMKKQMEVAKKNGTQGPISPAQPTPAQRNTDSRVNGSNGKQQQPTAQPFNPAYAGFNSESLESQPPFVSEYGVHFPN